MNVRVNTNTENPAGSPRVRRKEAADEFGAFQQLTQKLVNVPKAEVDAKRKEQA